MFPLFEIHGSLLCLIRRQHIIFPAGNIIQHTFCIHIFCRLILYTQQVFHDRFGIIIVIDGEGARVPNQVPIQLKLANTHAMECRRSDFAGIKVTQLFCQAFPHFIGSFIGERDSHDVIGRNRANTHSINKSFAWLCDGALYQRFQLRNQFFCYFSIYFIALISVAKQNHIGNALCDNGRFTASSSGDNKLGPFSMEYCLALAVVQSGKPRINILFAQGKKFLFQIQNNLAPFQ